MSEQNRIGFIGGGNMATAIIHGLLNNNIMAESIHVADPDDDQRNVLKELNTNLHLYEDGQDINVALDVLVLAVKPQIMQQVLLSLRNLFTPKTLVISIAAGVTLKNLSNWIGTNQAIVRCMPNTPALVGLGASGLFANELVNSEHRQLAESIFNSVGISFWLAKESDIDSVIAVSGSGPAYFFYLMECMEKTALELGLTPHIAKKLTTQTALGAAALADVSDDRPETLREKVSSKGGTTEAAIKNMQNREFEATIRAAMQAAVARAAALSENDNA